MSSNTPAAIPHHRTMSIDFLWQEGEKRKQCYINRRRVKNLQSNTMSHGKYTLTSVLGWLVDLLVGWLDGWLVGETCSPFLSVSPGAQDGSLRAVTLTGAANRLCCLTQSHLTDTGQTSPSTDITPGFNTAVSRLSISTSLVT